MNKSIWLLFAAAGIYLFSKARAAYNLEYTLTGIKFKGGILNPVVELTALIYNGTSIPVNVDSIHGEILGARDQRIASANILAPIKIAANGFEKVSLILQNIKVANFSADVPNTSYLRFEGFATVNGGRIKIPLSKKLF